jgi:hypothetical protein
VSKSRKMSSTFCSWSRYSAQTCAAVRRCFTYRTPSKPFTCTHTCIYLSPR